MGLTKTTQYTLEQNTLALLLKAIGHPARLAILELLIEKDSCVCGEIVDEIQLAQPTISQHLKALKEVDLIQGTIEGNSICYCINESVYQRLVDHLNGLNENLKNRKLKTCC